MGLYEALNLTCEAMGNPPPSYQWYQDGEEIPGANLPYLFIPEVNPEDRGSYTCAATNENGITTSNPGLTIIPGIHRASPLSMYNLYLVGIYYPSLSYRCLPVCSQLGDCRHYRSRSCHGINSRGYESTSIKKHSVVSPVTV